MDKDWIFPANFPQSSERVRETGSYPTARTTISSPRLRFFNGYQPAVHALEHFPVKWIRFTVRRCGEAKKRDDST